MTLKEIIYNFTDYETIVDNDYSISELNVDKKYDKYFISVLNKGTYLFIFEANSKKLYNNINLNLIFEGTYYWGKYNLISYKYENSTIKYIIYFIKDVYDSSGFKYIINFFHFTVNLLENNQKTITENAYTYRDIQILENFKNSSLDDNYIYYSTIYENYIDCQYIISADNKEGLICFYFTRKCFNDMNDGFRKISGSIFNIESNFSNISYAEFNITNYISYTNNIITVTSKNKNIFFVCFVSYCLIYNFLKNEFSGINKFLVESSNFKAYYFEAFNESLILSNYYLSGNSKAYFPYDYKFEIFILNDNFTHITNITKIDFTEECRNYQNRKLYLIYLLNNYILIDDCRIKEGSQIEDFSLVAYLSLISSLSVDTSLPTKYPYSLPMIESTLISTSISLKDSFSYSDNIVSTEVSSTYINSSFSYDTSSIFFYSNISNYSNGSNYTNQFNHTSDYIYSNMSNYIITSTYINQFTYTNPVNEINISNTINIFNYTNIIDLADKSIATNSYLNIGKEILDNKISMDKNDIIEKIWK